MNKIWWITNTRAEGKESGMVHERKSNNNELPKSLYIEWTAPKENIGFLEIKVSVNKFIIHFVSNVTFKMQQDYICRTKYLQI